MILPLPRSLRSSSGYSPLPTQSPRMPRPSTPESLSGASLLVEVAKLGEQGPNFFSPCAARPVSASSHLYPSPPRPPPLHPPPPQSVLPPPSLVVTPSSI